MKYTKGTSLVELVVSMAIFVTVTTLAIGAYVTVMRMRSFTSVMREAQQKTRIAVEMITRFSRQSEKTIVSQDGKTLELYYKIKTIPTAKKFEITNTTIKYYDRCVTPNPILTTNVKCNTWGPEIDLLAGTFKLDDDPPQPDLFTKRVGPTFPILDIKLTGEINKLSTNSFFKNKMIIETSIPLENSK